MCVFVLSASAVPRRERDVWPAASGVVLLRKVKLMDTMNQNETKKCVLANESRVSSELPHGEYGCAFL